MIGYCFAISDFDLRLVGGSSDREGRVEIFHEGSWGTVCDDYWDANDAAVVCSYLGFTGTSEAVGSAAFGEGTGEIFLDDVNCSGEEGSLAQCGHRGWNSHNCGHHEDAGVRCALDDSSGMTFLLK